MQEQDRLVILAQPFKSLGKEYLKESEFVFSLSLDLKWFGPAEARDVLDHGLNTGLLKKNKGNIFPGFDISEVEKPHSFKPSLESFDTADWLDMVVEEVMKTTGKNKKEVFQEMNRFKERFDGLLEPETSIIMVARAHGIDVNEFLSSTDAPHSSRSSPGKSA